MNLPGKQLVRFSITGAVNTLIGYVVIFSLMILSVSPVLSNIAGYTVGLAVSFVLQRTWVFNDHSNIRRQTIRFLATFAVSFALNFITLKVALQNDVNPYIAQLFACITYSVTFFLLNKTLVFSHNRSSSRQ